MSLPNYLAKIKSSGIYRFVWDKSVVPTQVAETLRLVVGYSEKGPFNTPVYIESPADFINIYGNISKKMERRGVFFNRLALQALAAGPILALNLKKFDDEQVNTFGLNFGGKTAGLVAKPVNLQDIYDRNRFWKLDEDQLPALLNSKTYMCMTSTDSKETSCTVYIRKSKHADIYDTTIRNWYSENPEDMPSYLEKLQDMNLKDTFVDVYVFRGQITPDLANGILKDYFDAVDGAAAAKKGAKTSEPGFKLKENYTDIFKNPADALDALADDPNSNLVGKYTGTTIPYFKSSNGSYISLDLVFNADYHTHKMLMKMNEDMLYNAGDNVNIIKEYLNTSTAAGETPSMPLLVENVYLEGYTYSNTHEKQLLQEDSLSMLDDKGIYTALTNRIDAEYRYIVDTFESYIETGCKGKLAAIAKAKDNAFAILNCPSMQSFVKDPKFKDEKGNFDIAKLADANNGFTLASEVTGASWCAYFTPVKFSDGTVKSIVPSAALVSNNFMEKYGPRQPYYIVAGPNYGRINYDGMVGPDYNYGRSDLDVLEPMGINAIVYVPRKGTYINSNQTAKQKPVSGLSKIHVRELIIFLQDEIEAMLQDYQWELNTQALRDTIKSKADTICDRVKNNGGIYAFFNVCDETNNTPEVIDNEMIILDTEIEPARGCGKMVQKLTIHKTGGITSK